MDPKRHRAWPPWPGFDVAFGAPWPSPAKSYYIDKNALVSAATKSEGHDRAYSVANLYIAAVANVSWLDTKPALAICIVPDEVYDHCKPESYVPASERSDEPKTSAERNFIKKVLKDREVGQDRLFDDADAHTDGLTQNLERFDLSPDFRRQIKARLMAYDLPVQIIRESTLRVTPEVRQGLPKVNPLSDRLWNFSTALFYKCGMKPWKTPWAREGVCYVGLAYKVAADNKTACCAAQMFLDSGDGVVFVGEFGPWYSEKSKEFHLPPEKAEALLRGTIETYQAQEGKSLKEIFLHARSGINEEEYEGFKRACPPGVRLVAIRVRPDGDMRLYRYDDNPKVTERGKHPVQRGLFWQRSARHGLLFTTGFKPRVATYDGWETPVPLAITVQHGDGDLLQVARDILGLTKLNYNACDIGESQPITVKYSERVGEILLANRGLPREGWRHNFKFYI
jgi:hypothetical protein